MTMKNVFFVFALTLVVGFGEAYAQDAPAKAGKPQKAAKAAKPSSCAPA
jgi:hypothetical protein